MLIAQKSNLELSAELIELRKSARLGDKIASNPIVHAIGKATGCVDAKTNQLKPESGCGKMKARLNAGMSVAEAMKLRLQGK